jgi:hypothetical protein
MFQLHHFCISPFSLGLMNSRYETARYLSSSLFTASHHIPNEFQNCLVQPEASGLTFRVHCSESAGPSSSLAVLFCESWHWVWRPPLYLAHLQPHRRSLQPNKFYSELYPADAVCFVVTSCHGQSSHDADCSFFFHTNYSTTYAGSIRSTPSVESPKCNLSQGLHQILVSLLMCNHEKVEGENLSQRFLVARRKIHLPLYGIQRKINGPSLHAGAATLLRRRRRSRHIFASGALL